MPFLDSLVSSFADNGIKDSKPYKINVNTKQARAQLGLNLCGATFSPIHSEVPFFGGGVFFSSINQCY